MLKMLIKIDEERLVKDDRYDLDDYWESIDFRFKDNCTKVVLPDGSVLYSGIEGADYFNEISAAYIVLSRKEWFAQYVTKWIWYENLSIKGQPLSSINLLEKQRAQNPIFQKIS